METRQGMETLTTANDVGDKVGIDELILTRLSDDPTSDVVDTEIRKILSATSEVLRDKKVVPTPTAYLSSTISSLDTAPSDSVIRAHYKIVSALLPQVPADFLIKNHKPLTKSLRRPLKRLRLEKETYSSAFNCLTEFILNSVPTCPQWSYVSRPYNMLLNSIDLRVSGQPRYQLYKCIQDVLKSFHGTPLLDPASKAIADRLWSDPGGPHSIVIVGITLSLMTSHHRTALLNHLKTLLEHKFAYQLSEDILDALHTFCLDLSPDLDVSPELLLDLICSMCVIFHKFNYDSHTDKKFADFLNVAVAKAYSLNKQICQTKLPIVFDALKVLLGKLYVNCRDLEVRPDTAHTFTCLIRACIDESLIKEGVDHVSMNANLEDDGYHQYSVPTVIENLCATVHSLLSYGNPIVRHLTIQIIATMFDKLGESSCHLMKDTLKTLADLQKLPDEESPFKEKVYLLLEMIVDKCGIDTLVTVMPQEHMKLLQEIKKQLDSKSVEARCYESIETIISNYLSQSDKSIVDWNLEKEKITMAWWKERWPGGKKEWQRLQRVRGLNSLNT